MKKPEAVRWEKLEGQGDSPKLKQFTPGLFSEILSVKWLIYIKLLAVINNFFVLNIVNKNLSFIFTKKSLIVLFLLPGIDRKSLQGIIKT